MPRCKHCLTKFEVKFFNQKYCMSTEECTDASIKFVLDNNRKLSEKKEKDDWKVKKAEIKEKLKTLSDYEKDLQIEINEMVRLIDGGLPCISCGGWSMAHAGHFHSRGRNPTLRFNLHNIHRQENYCNVELSGNTTGYNLGLIEWYGKAYQEYVEYELPKLYPLLKWTKNDLILWTAQARVFKKEIMKLEKPLEESDRVFWRTFYNEKLGIYKENITNL